MSLPDIMRQILGPGSFPRYINDQDPEIIAQDSEPVDSRDPKNIGGKKPQPPKPPKGSEPQSNPL